MASIIESEAVFEARLRACGLETRAGGFQGERMEHVEHLLRSHLHGPQALGMTPTSWHRFSGHCWGSATHVDVPKVRKLYFRSLHDGGC